MDGNGRWARNRGKPRLHGHYEGVKTVDRVTEACAEAGIKALTLYTFSTENWKRSSSEIKGLMKLLSENIRTYGKKLYKNNICFNYIGEIDAFPGRLPSLLKDLKEKTAANSGMVLTLALNYGGRQEILSAARKICRQHLDGSMNVFEAGIEDFASCLDTAGLPEVDLVIRTSGEKRLSNFLLWQSAYSELYFTDTLWPDFGLKELERAFEEFASRERRFGG
jgi:undecaprenyl diphosphate synthase